MLKFFYKVEVRFRVIIRNLKFYFFVIYTILGTFFPLFLRRKLKIKEIFVFAQPWYHDFGSLGIRTPQNTIRTYKFNQRLKEGVLYPWIKNALNDLEISILDREIRISEYFAADSFYGLFALKHSGKSNLLAVDLGSQSGEGASRNYVLDQGLLIAKALGVQNRFSQVNASVFDVVDKCDLLLNIGGLYHVNHVDELITKSFLTGASIMIIQTVVHEDPQKEEFYLSPAPNWTWGSRFSASWLRTQVITAGWSIEHEAFNILELNESAFDRGSYYLYCVKPA